MLERLLHQLSIHRNVNKIYIQCAAKAVQSVSDRLSVAAADGCKTFKAADDHSSTSCVTQPAAVDAVVSRGDAPRVIGYYKHMLRRFRPRCTAKSVCRPEFPKPESKNWFRIVERATPNVMIHLVHLANRTIRL